VPLLVLTADRPPELRDVGAGQTIDQVKLYGSAAKWFMEVDDHAATPERLRWMRQLACRACWTALDGRPGPVHLNFSLREPLVLDAPLAPEAAGGGGRAGGRPWVTRPGRVAAPAPAVVDAVAGELAARPRTVIVAGRAERDPALGPALAALAEQGGFPLLAEPTSGARRGPAAIAHYDALLRDPAWGRRFAPELVLRVGDLPTSKPLRQWLAGLGEEALQLVLDPETAWQDPTGVAATLLPADPRSLVAALVPGLPPKPRDAEWLAAWTRADRAAAHAIADALGPAGLSEPRIAAELGVRLPAEATLVVASSMPIRDVETFFPARPSPFRVLANRGANGIDGTTSTAFGVAAASSGPVVLLTGDVALQHDIGGLLAARRPGVAPLTIVLIDNDGGGIFAFLPVAGAGAGYEEHVATAHGLDFAHAAALYRLDHVRVADPERFREAIDAALASPRSTLIHIRTDREANVALHRAVWDAVRAAV
jgi:2-succinyl-5-enolpyruvyl-6-hydroxy-3-cyclohexene-1-carboxylate synthase